VVFVRAPDGDAAPMTASTTAVTAINERRVGFISPREDGRLGATANPKDTGGARAFGWRERATRCVPDYSEGTDEPEISDVEEATHRDGRADRANGRAHQQQDDAGADDLVPRHDE